MSSGYIESMHYGSDGFLYSGCSSGTLRKINPTTMTEVGKIELMSQINSIHRGLDGRIYCGSANHQVKRIHSSTMLEVGSYDGDSHVSSVHYGLDGHLYCAFFDHTLRKLDPATMVEIERMYVNGITKSIHCASDGLIYCGNNAGNIQRIDPVSMSEVGIFEEYGDFGNSPFDVNSIHYGRDGFLYAGSSDHTARKINPTTMTEVGRFEKPNDFVLSVHLGSDGFLYVGGINTTIIKVDPATMTEVGSIEVEGTSGGLNDLNDGTGDGTGDGTEDGTGDGTEDGTGDGTGDGILTGDYLADFVDKGDSANGTMEFGAPETNSNEISYELTMTLNPGDTTSVMSYDIYYNPEIVGEWSAVAGPAATDANKLVATNIVEPGWFRMIVYGINYDLMTSGVVATVTLTSENGLEGVALKMNSAAAGIEESDVDFGTNEIINGMPTVIENGIDQNENHNYLEAFVDQGDPSNGTMEFGAPETNGNEISYDLTMTHSLGATLSVLDISIYYDPERVNEWSVVSGPVAIDAGKSAEITIVDPGWSRVIVHAMNDVAITGSGVVVTVTLTSGHGLEGLSLKMNATARLNITDPDVDFGTNEIVNGTPV